MSADKISLRLFVLSLLATLLLVMTACDDVVGPGDENEPITELPRALTVVESQVIDRSNDFGLALLREVVEHDERANVVLSPLSASMALGMTMNGTDSATFDAMRTALAFDSLDQTEINEAYRGLIDLLTGLDPAVRFDIANSIWANQDIPFHQVFFDAVAEAFDAVAASRDFGDPATVDEINAWVSDQTEDLIDTIVQQLDPDLVMLLINAIYFDGSWTTQFDPADTRRQAFHRADGSTVDVDMMSIADVELGFGFGSVAGASYTAVELPYGGEAFSMIVAVPDGDVAELVAGLTSESWASLVDGLEPMEVDGVSIPKLELSYDAYLNDALKAMGMEIAFGPDADFTRLSPIGDQLCISFVRQKTFLEVDERGTRAAAVTAVGVGLESFIGLTADRPFVLAIRERLSGTILFVGVIGDPTAEDPGPEPFVDTCM